MGMNNSIQEKEDAIKELEALKNFMNDEIKQICTERSQVKACIEAGMPGFEDEEKYANRFKIQDQDEKEKRGQVISLTNQIQEIRIEKEKIEMKKEAAEKDN